MTAPLPTSFRIRDLTIAPNVVLAPMEGVTDLYFRRVIRRVGGVGYTCTEFVPAKGLSLKGRKVLQTCSFDPDESPIVIQIYGRDPEQMAQAGRIVQDLGATIVDINMGCPSKKVCAHSGGSALMKEPERVRDIVRAVRAAVDLPLTVKMRSGFDAGQRNAPEIAWIAQEEGAEAVTIHWRTREDRYGGQRAVDKIAETKARLTVPVLGNGDVVDVASALRMFRDTGVDGVMIGRGAIQNPWLGLQISQALRGEEVVQPSARARREALFFYFDEIRAAFHSEKGALGRMKMVSKHFTQALPHADDLRTQVLRSRSPDEALALLEAYFEVLEAAETRAA
jgi:tRNA-dihydrouridine synthase B